MDRALIVEVLDRRGHVASRHRLDVFPATIGRGYGCGVILDDRFVSPEHVRVTRDADGGLAAEDLDSLNGMREAGSAARVGRVSIRPGTRLRLGHTELRFCFPDQPVPPALLEAGDVLPVGPLAVTGRGGLALGAAAVGLLTLLSYLATYTKTSAAGVASEAVMFALLLALWAGVWAFCGRVLVHRPRFGLHVGVAALAVIGASLVERVLGYVRFLAPGAGGLGVVEALTGAAIVATALAGSVSLATALSRGRRVGVALGITVAVFGLARLEACEERQGFTSTAHFQGEIKALGGGWARATTVDGFFAEVTQLGAEVDSLADAARGADSARAAVPGR